MPTPPRPGEVSKRSVLPNCFLGNLAVAVENLALLRRENLVLCRRNDISILPLSSRTVVVVVVVYSRPIRGRQV